MTYYPSDPSSPPLGGPPRFRARAVLLGLALGLIAVALEYFGSADLDPGGRDLSGALWFAFWAVLVGLVTDVVLWQIRKSDHGT